MWSKLGLLLPLLASAVALEEGLEDICDMAFQIYYLQDVSWSFDDDLMAIRKQVPQFLSFLNLNFPGSSLAVGSFSDMPFPDVGFTAYEPFDNCYKKVVDFTDNPYLVSDKLDVLRLENGGDRSEVGMTTAGMIARWSDIWQNNPFTLPEKKNKKIVIISTDGLPHLAGDLQSELERHEVYWSMQMKRVNFGPQPSGEMPKYNVIPNNNDSELKCGQGGLNDLEYEEYLSIQQFAEAMREGDMIPIFFVTADVLEEYMGIVNILREEHNLFSFALKIRDNSSDLESTFRDAVHVVQQTSCVNPTTPPNVPDGVCDDGVLAEFLFVQDLTYSFNNDLDNLRILLPKVIDHLEGRFMEANIGLAAFGDKPIHPFGDLGSGDFCYKLLYPIGDNKDLFVESLNGLTTKSGLDWKECQMQALLSAALQEETNWSRESITQQNHAVLRIVALATDAGYHVAGDGQLGRVSRVNSGDGFNAEEEDDYPDTDQVMEALISMEITPLFLVTHDVRRIYDKLKVEWDAKGLYTIVETIESDSSDIASAILAGIDQVCLRDEKMYLQQKRRLSAIKNAIRSR